MPPARTEKACLVDHKGQAGRQRGARSTTTTAVAAPSRQLTVGQRQQEVERDGSHQERGDRGDRTGRHRRSEGSRAGASRPAVSATAASRASDRNEQWHRRSTLRRTCDPRIVATNAATAHTSVSPKATALTAVMPPGTWVEPDDDDGQGDHEQHAVEHDLRGRPLRCGTLSSMAASFTTTSICSALLIRPAPGGRRVSGRPSERAALSRSSPRARGQRRRHDADGCRIRRAARSTASALRRRHPRSPRRCGRRACGPPGRPPRPPRHRGSPGRWSGRRRAAGSGAR